MNLPLEFLNRMKKIVPEYDKFVDSYNDKPVKSFFVNTNKIHKDEFFSLCDWDVEPLAEGYSIVDDLKVGKTPEHHSGMIYMQEPSAMMPTHFLPLNHTDWVLDLCAAPGGKSIQVANRIPKGLLVSNEIVKSRANILKSNIERMGLSNVCITNNDPKELEKCFGGIFDAVVVDAPCSGEGMFRKDEQAILNWSQENVQACAVRQAAVLETANKMLKQNGYLLYSTCTFSVEEDENVVANFCKRHDYEIIELYYDGATRGVSVDGHNTQNCLRFYPHLFNGEGQFVALLRKNEQAVPYINDSTYYKPLSKFPTEYKLFEQFCKTNLKEYADLLDCVYNNGTIYYLANKKIAESGVRLINGGVVLGQALKGRFEPDHNFISCFGLRFKQCLDIDKEAAERFIKGMTLDCPLDGYVVVKYGGVVLGFGKASGGVLKNHYPKGLRNI